jgi:GTP-binding protein HflX
LLVVDVSDPIEEIREKLVTSHDTLYERNEAPIVTVLNKVDKVPEEEVERKREALSALAPSPIAVSALEGDGIAELRDRVDDELPPFERERLVLPMCDDAMSLVSWVHDHAHVNDVDYGEQVVVDFEARPSVIERSRARASDVAATAEH